MKYSKLLVSCLILFALTGCVTQASYDNLLTKYDSLKNEKEILLQNLSSAQDEKAGKIFHQKQRIEQLEKNLRLLKAQCKEKIAELTESEKKMAHDLRALHEESAANTKLLLNKNLELQEKCDAKSESNP